MLLWIILGYIALVVIALIPKNVSIYIKFFIIPIVSSIIFGLFHWNEWSKTDWSFLVLNKNSTTLSLASTGINSAIIQNTNIIKSQVIYMMFIFISCIVLYISYACLVLYGLGVVLLSMMGVSYNSHGHAPPMMGQSMRPMRYMGR
jgi:hypothetical protein